MRWLVLSGVVVAAVISGSGCLQKSEPSKQETVSRTGQAIQGGATDSADKFAIGVCIGPAGQCTGLCSGALILPNVVATARHCVSSTPANINCTTNPLFGGALSDTFSVTTNTTMEPANSGWYSVNSVAIPDDDHICGNDIALLILSKSVPAATATPITPGVQYLMWDPVANYSMYYNAIGYGATSTSVSDGSSGTRRILNHVEVLCIPGSPLYPCPKDFNANEFVGGDGTCHGDSGSSAYEKDLYAQGTPLSFGVLSRGDDSGGTCGTAIYSRFDAHRDFILKTAKQASNNWTLYPEPSWTEEKPLAVAPADPPPKGTKDAGSSGEPTLSKLGESCTTGDDCKSGTCAVQEDETKVCSQDCEDATGCPDGFECRESLCLPPLAGGEEDAPADTAKSSKSGCAVVSPARPGDSAATAALTVMAVLAFSAARRRRRAG